MTIITCQLAAGFLSAPWNNLIGNDWLDTCSSSIIISVSCITLISKIQSTYCHQLDTKHSTCYYSHPPTWFNLQHLLVRWTVIQILKTISVTFTIVQCTIVKLTLNLHLIYFCLCKLWYFDILFIDICFHLLLKKPVKGSNCVKIFACPASLAKTLLQKNLH